MATVVTIKLTAKEFDDTRQAVSLAASYAGVLSEHARKAGERKEAMDWDIKQDVYQGLLKGPLA